MHRINPNQDIFHFDDPERLPDPPPQSSTAAAVRDLAAQMLMQRANLVPQVNDPVTAPNVRILATGASAFAMEKLKVAFMGQDPNVDPAGFLRSLAGCTGQVREDARTIVETALSLDNDNSAALAAASPLLENDPRVLQVETPDGPLPLASSLAELNIIYRATGDPRVFQGPQPGDEGDLKTLHDTWELEGPDEPDNAPF